MFIDFREKGKEKKGGREREREKWEREKHPWEREIWIECLPYMPQLGIKQAT